MRLLEMSHYLLEIGIPGVRLRVVPPMVAPRKVTCVGGLRILVPIAQAVGRSVEQVVPILILRL